MNSWGNDRLEKRIDQLLTDSVSRGSEPAGFRVSIVPSRPAFPWMKLSYILAAAVVLGFFMMQWLSSQNLTADDYTSYFSADTLKGIFSGVSSDGLISAVAVIIGLGGTIMSFLSERQRVLHRML